MESILEQLDSRINVMLDKCSFEICPTVFGLISTAEGRRKIVELMHKRIIQQKLTIGEAMYQIDGEFNINSID
jgi:hypothetical protein